MIDEIKKQIQKCEEIAKKNKEVLEASLELIGSYKEQSKCGQTLDEQHFQERTTLQDFVNTEKMIEHQLETCKSFSVLSRTIKIQGVNPDLMRRIAHYTFKTRHVKTIGRGFTAHISKTILKLLTDALDALEKESE